MPSKGRRVSGDSFERLADLVGVAANYRDAFGREVAHGRARRADILARLGFPCGSQAEIAESLAQARELRGTLLPRVIVAGAGEPRNLALAGAGTAVWGLAEEGGRQHEGRAGEGVLTLPALPAGYHRLEARAGGASATATVIAAPPRCWEPDWMRERRRGWGLSAQVYALRSAGDCGIGGYGDIREAAEGAATHGASFLGLSPLHALFAADRTKVSPYSPSSRLFLESLHIDPAALPHIAGSEAGRLLDESGRAARLAALREQPLVDHAASWAVLAPVLEAYFAGHRQALAPSLDAFRREAGAALESHALFEALSEHFGREGRSWPGEWPQAFRRREPAALAAFAGENAGRIAFHAWLQQVADGQLREAQEAALRAGMAIGLYRDLAVGPDRGGSESWAAPDLFAGGLSIGAPPDLLAPQGQDWGLPPLHPLRLEAGGLDAFRALVRANLRHAGALRIDHAFQLRRLYLIPEGEGAAAGAYVAYPFAAMAAVLRIESHRARTLIVAEDLGTAPDGFAETIAASGILGYRVLFFERGAEGGFERPAAYPREAVTVLATHDLPTLAGWWEGLDIGLREDLGLYGPERAGEERAGRARDRKGLCEALAAEHLLPDAEPPPAPPREAVLRYLARTPSALCAVQYEDVLGLREQANLPGTVAEHPNWRRRLAAGLEAIHGPGGPLAAVGRAMESEGRGLALSPRR